MAGQLGVRMYVLDLAPPRPRAAGGVCVGSRQSGSDTSVRRESLGMCGTGCAVQEGGQLGCKEEGALRGARSNCGGASAVRMPCYGAAVPWIRSLATSSRAGGKLLGVRHTARRKVRRAVCCEERGREPR